MSGVNLPPIRLAMHMTAATTETRSMAKESIAGVMVTTSREAISKMSSTGMAKCTGLMVAAIEGFGSRECRKVLEC